MRMRHFVNEDKRVVTTVIENSEWDAIDSIRKAVHIAGKDWLIANAEYSFITDKFIGIAYCHPEDKFDVKIGIEVSKKKALTQYRKAVQRELEGYAQRLEQTAEAVRDRKQHFAIEK